MNLAVKFNLLKDTQPHYIYKPESCLENDNYKLYFDGFLVSESFGFRYVIPWAKNSGNVLGSLINPNKFILIVRLILGTDFFLSVSQAFFSFFLSKELH
jgi:hypothetical protein